MRTVITLVTSACLEGTGSGLIGVIAEDGPGNAAAPVLSFTAQPTTANVGQVLPAVQVVARDSVGSVITTFTGVVTLSLASNPTGAGLSGETSVRAANGIATFDDLSIDRPGSYTLRASATGAAPVTSDAFTIRSLGTP